MFFYKKHVSYFNIYGNIARYLLKLITTLYQIKNVSHRLFFLKLVFYAQIFVWTKLLKNADKFDDALLAFEKASRMKRIVKEEEVCIWNQNNSPSLKNVLV